ncbi:protein PLANT CADMIUM RESISTANCE 8-like [Telopea speciosissima]|uniref:protein PLANT CADMIUM RESISTANCE 8-like n=1 Tax=Telopea speciosissima TaxID=54955 RepID=UPI001CC3D6F2|nr:protein PLANT CADMIUM RESISTANCE 8-like [Telopea speciosissima]
MMADSEEKPINGVEEKGEDTFMEGVTVLDFDMLCATVALQTQEFSKEKWDKLEENIHGNGMEIGGVQRMWEGEVLDCFVDRRIAIETACCPCYRFGKNMGRAGFGCGFIHGAVYFVLAVTALLNLIAFAVTMRRCFLYLVLAFIILAGTYLGFFRTQIRKQFHIRGSDSCLDDCVNHLICPCCTLCQESRTLEINNVQDGIWRGRGDTICIGSYGEGSKGFFELRQPPLIPTKSPDLCSMQKATNGRDHSWIPDASHSEPLVSESQE